MKKILIILSIFVITACPSAPFKELKDDKHNKCEFRINQNYQQVYRDIINSNIFPSVGVIANLYTDIQQGQILIRQEINPDNCHVLTEVTATSNEETLISIRYVDMYGYYCEDIRELFGL
ncbi:MAG: hypothetical protein HGJ94_09155 [Desulfosarcina sp.]|nr:hypothetical protein [Desulfosarcina sp.]